MDFESKKSKEASIYSVGLGEKERLVSSFTKHVVDTNFKETREREVAVQKTKNHYDMIAQIAQEKADDEADYSETEEREHLHRKQLGKRSLQYARKEEAILEEFEESQRKRGKTDPFDRLFGIATHQDTTLKKPKPRLSVSALVTKKKSKGGSSPIRESTTPSPSEPAAVGPTVCTDLELKGENLSAIKDDTQGCPQEDNQNDGLGLLGGYASESSSEESEDSQPKLPPPKL